MTRSWKLRGGVNVMAAATFAIVATTAMAQAPTPAPAPTTRIIMDEFSDPTTGWPVRTDGLLELSYYEGIYRFAMSGPSPLQLASTGLWFADGVISVDLAELPPSVPHPQGVFVRGQDANNYYGFLVQSDETFTVFRWENGMFFEISQPSARLPAGLYHADALNAVDVIMQGPIIRFFLNYTEVWSLNDAKWNDGIAGLLAANLTYSPAATQFDNWRVEIAR